MSKQQTCQRFIFKLHSARLREAGWDLTLPLVDARRNDEVISLSDSQILRWIDELNGVKDADFRAKTLKKSIKMAKKEENSLQNRKKIRKLYQELDELQFKPDYMSLIIDKEKDYVRACKGFTINGIKYVRLLGTVNGVKQSTIVFVSERLAPELRRRISNGRDETKEMVPSKLEAYRALVCSGSTPVSMPRGAVVVNDCVTHFHADVIKLDDSANGEPVMTFEADAEVELDESDGYGIMLPSLAQRWSEELHLDYVTSGVNCRMSFLKGMIFPFDFLEFADTVAGTRMITDAWGNEVDLSNVELILTTSQLKLWDHYPDMETYLKCCQENHYQMGIAKTTPRELDTVRNLNYQFIQPFELTDDDIDELIAPTVREIHDILGLDWRKSILYLKGTDMTEKSLCDLEPDFTTALMANPQMIDDPYVRRKIYNLIKKRITDAKIGVIQVHGNYTIISGDPYALCQSIFGLPVTGLLKAGELYNKFWLDQGVEKVVCFRAPMSCAENILVMNVSQSEDARHWYQYMDRCTALNAWDTACHALNGCDKDGDLLFTTDNPVFLRRHKKLPALMCAQHKAAKCVPDEDSLMRSNIAGFGDDIGKITNHVTAMYDVIVNFEPGTKEYDTLEYRIKAGQKFQQDAIDKTKGIISLPMPRWWYDRKFILKSDAFDDEEKEFLLSIVADKKPSFMRYIYPDVMREHKEYTTNTSKKAVREFRIKIEDLLAKEEEDDLTEEERVFLSYYHAKMPVSINSCVMNRIMLRFESEFDSMVLKRVNMKPFDYTIMKSGIPYSDRQRDRVSELCKDYNSRLQDYLKTASAARVDDDEISVCRAVMIEDFRAQCLEVCSNSAQLSDILLDVCYSREGSKQFVWDICGEDLVRALLEGSNHTVMFPVKDESGDVEYGGVRYSFVKKQLREVCGYDSTRTE